MTNIAFLLKYVYVGLPEEDAEQLAQVHVVWSLLKAQATAVVQIHGKLCWETLRTCIHTFELCGCEDNFYHCPCLTCSYLTEDLNRG